MKIYKDLGLGKNSFLTHLTFSFKVIRIIISHVGVNSLNTVIIIIL